MDDADTLPTAPALSAWRTIWFSPRRTIRRIVDAEGRPSWIPVIALAALHTAILSVFVASGDGSVSISRYVMPVIVGVLQLIGSVIIGPFLLAFLGGWLGGEADPTEIRQSVSWSHVPYAVATVCWIPILATFGTRAFGQDNAPESAIQWLALLMFLMIFPCIAWTLVLQVITLAEVQRFSIARAFACVLVVVILPALAL